MLKAALRHTLSHLILSTACWVGNFVPIFQERRLRFGEIKLVKVWRSRASHAGPLLLPHGSGERTEKQPLECEPSTLLEDPEAQKG